MTPDSTNDDEIIEAPLTFRAIVLHACSGPPRSGSYSCHLKSLGAECMDVDRCIDAASMDLTTDHGWDPVWDKVRAGYFAGAQMDPQCSTFSRVRSRRGGPKPLRSPQGSELDGLKGLKGRDE